MEEVEIPEQGKESGEKTKDTNNTTCGDNRKEKEKQPKEEMFHETSHSQVTDKEKKFIYSNFEIFMVLLGAVILLADVVSDTYTACSHWWNEDYFWFALTLVFICIPSLVMMFISLFCYINDRENTKLKKVSKFKWRVRIVLLLLQLGPLVRYYETLKFGWKSRKFKKSNDRVNQRRYYKWMLHEDSDRMLLRITECFMEAAPQLILQLYILMQADDPVKYTTQWRIWISFSCALSMLSLAFGVTAFFRSIRATYNESISKTGSVTLFLWHFFCLAARMAAMVLFTSVFQLWLLLLCVIHWVMMVAWHMFRRRKRNSSLLLKSLVSFFMGFIYIFVFLNDDDGPTREKYISYYTLWEVENVFMIVMWLIYGYPTKPTYLPVAIIHFPAFILGVVFMIVYYKFLHPRHSEALSASTFGQAFFTAFSTFFPLNRC